MEIVAAQPTQNQIGWKGFEKQFEPVELPLVISVAEANIDRMTRSKAGHFMAQVVMRHEAEQPRHKPKIDSLKEGIYLATEGDPDGEAMVEANVAPDVIERTIKVGHVGAEVELEVDENVNILQHGQPMESVQANSLLYASNHPAIKGRVKPEIRNSFRIKERLSNGILEDYIFVASSLAADDMSEADMSKAGFFVDTMSASLQGTTIKDGVLIMEPAFVAGVTEPRGPRHDKQAIVALYKKLGVDISGKSAAEIIDTPLLIHKSLLPNGMIDFVKLYDDCAGGIFFGQAKPREDYVAFREKCRQRELTFRDKIKLITAELISEAPTILTEVQAARRLNKISGKHMVDKAIEDPTINPSVFGEAAAAEIIQARHLIETGNYEQAVLARNRARTKETSGSCPGDVGDKDELGNETDVYGFSKSEKISLPGDLHGKRTFRCSNGHLNVRWKKNELLTKCQHTGCKAVVGCGPKKAPARDRRPEVNNASDEQKKRRGIGRTALKLQLVRKREELLEIKRWADQRRPDNGL